MLPITVAVEAVVPEVVDGGFPAFACCGLGMNVLMSLRRGCSCGTGSSEERSPNKCCGNTDGYYTKHRLAHGFSLS
jgi:hypothetical protein